MKLSVLRASSALIPQETKPTTCQQLLLQDSWNAGSMQVICRTSLVYRLLLQGSDSPLFQVELFQHLLFLCPFTLDYITPSAMTCLRRKVRLDEFQRSFPAPAFSDFVIL